MEEILDLWTSDLDLNQARHTAFLSAQSQLPPENRNPFYEWLRNNKEPLPIRSILTNIRRRHEGFGIFEYPYLDLEFWDSYAGFYGTCFTLKNRACRRLHLFKGDETAGDRAIELLEAGSTEYEIKNLGLEYIGYSVFRPIRSNVIGRTGIAFDERPTWEFCNDPLLKDDEGRPILKAQQTCTVTLLNARFSINTSEFIQQDPQLGQCASASLWVASNIASKKFGTRHVKFSNITKNAVGPKLPNIPLSYVPIEQDTGLTSTEIKNALSATGTMYQAESSKFSEENSLGATVRLSHFIYSFVESGLPVILCMYTPTSHIGHAIAAIGHFLPTKVDSSKAITLDKVTKDPVHARHTLVSNFIDLYYVHDDCYGPFNRLRLVLPKGGFREIILSKFTDEKPLLRAKLGRRREEYRLTEAIVPVHFRLRNAAWHSLPFAIDIVEKIYGEGLSKSTIFLWRSLLVSGSEFKRSLRPGKRGFSSTFLSAYARIHLSKYLWVHEFTTTTREEISNCFPTMGNRTVDGEFLVDATTATNDAKILAWRVGETMWAEELGVVYDSEADEFPCFDMKFLEGIP